MTLTNNEKPFTVKSVSVDNSNAASIDNDDFIRFSTFKLVAGATAPSSTAAITVPDSGRSPFVVINSLSVSATVGISGQANPLVSLAAGSTGTFSTDGSDISASAGSASAGGSGSVDQTARDGIVVNAFRIAIGDALSLLGLVDGFSDVYTDETGVDAAASSNETYDATDDFYTNDPGTFGADLTTTGQAIGSTPTPTFTADKAYDDDTGTRWASQETNAAVIGVSWVGQDFGASNDKVIRQVGMQQHQSASPARLTGTDAIKVQSSPDNSVWTDVSTISPVDDATMQLFSVPASTARRYWRFLANAAVSGGNAWSVVEGQMHEIGVISDLDLRSESVTALAEADGARVIILKEDVGAFATTDVVLSASRDGGTTYTSGTTEEISDNFDSTKDVWVADVDISGQPSGTSMKYRVQTSNGEILKVHGAALLWS